MKSSELYDLGAVCRLNWVTVTLPERAESLKRCIERTMA